MGKLMQEIFEKETVLKVAKKLEKISIEKNIPILELVEQYKKAHSLTEQSIENEHKKPINSILPLGTDIDNNQIYDEETGETIKELIRRMEK